MIGKPRRFKPLVVDFNDEALAAKSLGYTGNGFLMGRIHRYYGMDEKPLPLLGTIVRIKGTGSLYEVTGWVFSGRKRLVSAKDLASGVSFELHQNELETMSGLEALGQVAE